MPKSTFRGTPTITQSNHGTLANGKPQLAWDMSPKFPWMINWNLYAPMDGKITKIVYDSIAHKIAGYIVFRTVDGASHWHVHCLPISGYKVGMEIKEGKKFGAINPKPKVNATGAHDHYFILGKTGTAVNKKTYYDKLDVKKWYRDPNKLIK
jgi:hypothetical protein